MHCLFSSQVYLDLYREVDANIETRNFV